LPQTAAFKLKKEDKMSLAKIKIRCLFLAVFSCLLLSPTVYAVDNEEMMPPERDNSSRHVFSQNSSEIDLPVGEKGFYKPWVWGNDVIIATGTVAGGISTDYDTAGNLYAARCSTYYDKGVHSRVIVYKSDDNGASWSKFCQYGPFAVTFSYPVILTGSIGNRLYVFVLGSQNNGEVWMARFNAQTGGFETSMGVATGVADTISYFTACTNMGRGDTIVIVFQRDRTGATPYLYSTMSTDYGETWSTAQPQSIDGEHPDIAYGQGGNVYLAYHKTEKDDIGFLRGRTYETGMWVYFKLLTTDTTSRHDDFPKIAALHTSPVDSATVWVAYNHTEPGDKLETVDLRFAYSTNSGVDWTKDQILANSPIHHEMASDLKVYRSTVIPIVDLCYLKHAIICKSTLDVCYTWAYSTSPHQFHTPHEKINDHLPYFSPDSREVCQLTFSAPPGGFPGIVYAGVPSLKDDGWNPYDGAWDIYFDYYPWTDVEEEVAVEGLPAKFCLSANYPNPFNPVTRIQYTVGSRQTPEKAVDGSQFTVHGPIPITLKIYNILGQLVRTLVNEPKEPGTYEVIWDGKDESGDQVASGVYFYKLEAENFSRTKKMVLIR
jgi:hypothetical protein